MPFKRKRPDWFLKKDVQAELLRMSKSRTEKAVRVERARMLLLYSEGVSVSAIAREFTTNRPKVDRCVDKALQLGALAALNDLPRSGKHRRLLPRQRRGLSTSPAKSQKSSDILMSYGPIGFYHNSRASIVGRPGILPY